MKVILHKFDLNYGSQQGMVVHWSISDRLPGNTVGMMLLRPHRECEVIESELSNKNTKNRILTLLILRQGKDRGY